MFSLKDKYKRISYSQCAEDLIINHIVSGRHEQLTYIDIGANHPWKFNNTAYFYLKGFRGINIEPDPYLFKLLKKHRDKDINLNIGISTTPGNMDFYIMSSRTLSTFSKEEADQLKKLHDCEIIEICKIPVNTIQNVINQYSKGKFPDLVSIDVEGFEFDIIKSIDFQGPIPKIICIETVSYSNTGYGIKNESLISYIMSKGYMIYADTYINTIFVLEKFWKK